VPRQRLLWLSTNWQALSKNCLFRVELNRIWRIKRIESDYGAAEVEGLGRETLSKGGQARIQERMRRR